MRLIRFMCIILPIFCGPFRILSQPIIQIPDSIAQRQTYAGENFFDISSNIQILRDSTQKLTWKQLNKNLKHYQFRSNNSHNKPLGHFENYWTRFTLVSPIDQTYFINIPQTFNAECYIPLSSDSIIVQYTGYNLPVSKRTVKGFRKHFFKLKLKANRPTTIFILFKIKYRAFFNSEIIISLYPAKAYANSPYLNRVKKSNEIFQYIWLLLMLYNGLLFLIIRERLYLTYVFYILGWLGFNDATFHIFVSYFPEASLVLSWRFFTFIYVACSLLFLQQYLKVKHFLPKFHRINRGVLWFLGWLILYNLVDILLSPSVIPPSSFTESFYDFTLYVVQICIGITALLPLLFFIEAVIILRKGYRPAIWYIAGSSVLLLSLSGFYLLNYIFSYNHLDAWWGNFLQIAQHIGFTIEMIIFSLGIGYRYNRVQKETQHLLKNQNILLESQVKERTKMLEEANEEITTQRDTLALKNKDILDSINYAQYIQQAFLPSIANIQAVLPNSFVFFRPKEKVSGDFYWFAHLNPTSRQIIGKVYGEPTTPFTKTSSKIILAAADCTGHGAAGALLSMVGNNTLNKIIWEKGIVEADKILNLLHLNIRQLLYQQEAHFGVGMDISLVVIDPETHTLEFAGALNSLVMFQNNEMKVIKGDLLNIGGATRNINRKFHKHIIDISTPTTLYMFSDGYRDQFGGKKGKKFGSPQFYRLLKQIQAMPVTDQLGILENTLNEWMNNQYDQLDDMLIIGIHLTPENLGNSVKNTSTK